MKVEKPGTYLLSATEYHADPCPWPSLSRSVAEAFVHRSPLHAWWQHPRLNPDYAESESNRTSLGALCHTLLLGEGRGVAVYEGKDWRSNAAQEFKAAALEAGETPVTTPQYEQAERIVRAAKRQLGDLGTLTSELCWVSKELEGLWLRCMTDLASPDGTVVYDYKTTSTAADPRVSARRQAANLGYDFQQAFYERVMAGVKPDLAGRITFRFIFQEIDAPYALSVLELSEADVAVARRQVDYAVTRWFECLDRDEWPGYGADPVRVALPEWRIRDWLEREEELSDGA